MTATFSFIEIIVILIVILVIVKATKDGGRRDAPQGRYRTPPRHPRAHPQGPPLSYGPPFRPRPAVNVATLIMALIFFPFVLAFWAIASIGDLVLIPVHLAAGAITFVVALMGSLVGGSPRRLWRATARQFKLAGRAVRSIIARLLSFFGMGGVSDRLMGRRLPQGPPPLPVRPGPYPSASSRTYPFEDRYRIEGHLGSGGSTARLFIVRRVERHRPVGDRLVLKYFDMGMGSRLEEVIRESRGMQVAKDMGIVLDHNLARDHFYYVMPYYEGETLTRASARMHRQLPAETWLDEDSVRTALSWMAELLRILDGYHRHGVIHKDVKPDNVIVTDQGIRLVDLGLLTPLASALTLTTHGTEYFRDPEMVKLAVAGKRVKDVDAVRFDIYSAGAVMYLLLEGSFPACGPLSRFSRPVPMALSWITSRSMAEGSKRYPTVGAMRADLEETIRQMNREDLDRLPVSKLPSFGGFDAAEAAAPVPLAPQVRCAPPPPPRLEPMPVAHAGAARHGSSKWPYLLVVLVVFGLGAFTLYGWIGLSAPAPQVAESSHQPHRTTTVTEPHELVSGIVLHWRQEVVDQYTLTGEGEAVRNVPILFVPDESVELDTLVDLVKRKVIQSSRTTVHPSSSLTRRVREIPRGVPPEEVQKLLLQAVGEDTLPMVVRITDEGYIGDPNRGEMVRRIALSFYYRSIHRTKRILVSTTGSDAWQEGER